VEIAMPEPKSGCITYIATHTNEAVYVRDRSLVDELIGKLTFTEMFLLHLLGRMPTRAEQVIVDAVLVTLMEHGFTPSVIAARMVAISSPEALQAAVAGGLLCVGGQFVGTMEEAAEVISEVMSHAEGVDAGARAVAQRYRAERRPLPGFGHHLHRPDDPRSPRLFALAGEAGVSGRHIAALQALSRAVDEVYGRHITINATGAIAAVLGEIGIEPRIMRGIAVLSRCAGLVGHIREEQQHPAARKIWEMAEEAVEYAGTQGARGKRP
jgi:citrate synthase